MSPNAPLVVEAVRGDVVESAHLIDVAVTDPAGTLAAWAGEPDTIAYLRSAAKPIQATVCLELGWRPPGDTHLAVACASHNGEPQHVDAVRAILAGAHLDEDALQCPDESRGRIFHNCSGKHAAMLGAVVANGWEPDSYRNADNELQRAVSARIEGLAGRPARGFAPDGCGVPTFAFTLAEAATIFARLPGEADRALDAMRSHPGFVAGSNRICTSVMSRIPGVVLKVGAEGLLCGVLLDRRTGFAVKARDGAARGREIAAVRALEMLGVLGDVPPERIVEDIVPRLYPVAGGEPPRLRCRGELQRA